MADLDVQDNVSSESVYSINGVHDTSKTLQSCNDKFLAIKSSMSDVSSCHHLSTNNLALLPENNTLNHKASDNLVEPLSNSNFQINSVDYKVGDVVWAKIGRYPYWPSVICLEPNSNKYYKQYSKLRKSLCIHVRFCNDNGRRSWVRVIEKYLGKDELLIKYPTCLASIKQKTKIMDIWNTAVAEADCLMTYNIEKRLLEFFKTFVIPSADIKSIKSTKKSPKPSTAEKLQIYSRKRAQTTFVEPECKKQRLKIENLSTSDSTISKSINTLSRSDNIDEPVPNMVESFVYLENIENNVEEGHFKKTYIPTSSMNDKNNLPDSDSENDENHNSDNETSITDMNDDNLIVTNSNRKVEESLKLQIKLLEENDEQERKNTNYLVPVKKKVNAKRTTKMGIKKSSNYILQYMDTLADTQKNSIKVENEHSPEPTKSVATSKTESYSSVYISSQENKELFVKTLKKACVVCENFKNTIRCTGLCQDYFHKECLAKSENRYNFLKQSMNANNKKNQELNEKVHNKNNTNDNFNDMTITKGECSNIKAENGFNQQGNVQQFKDLDSPTEDSTSKSSTEKIEKYLIKPKNKLTNSVKTIKPIDLEHMCSLCKANKIYCFICGLNVDKDSEQQKCVTCKLANCGKSYHTKCLDEWPQVQWIQGSNNSSQTIICPLHVCHLCISENPKSKCKIKIPAEKLIRCIKCPTAYHRSEYCLPAGSRVLTYNNIVCSRHSEPNNKQAHINATWCFICTQGGSLVCCDSCPASFHIECLNLHPSKFEGSFTCEECQTGRYPLYGEIVWVKISSYRWWPAQIVFPNQVPASVNATVHSSDQFAVRFFGTYDYYWVNRGRVFNFHEGDDENMLVKIKCKAIDQVFQDAVIEAAQAHNAYIIDKDRYDAKELNETLKNPPKYTKIKFNRPVGNVKEMETSLIPMTSCECDPTKPNPCGPDSDCINRMLMFECQARLCPAGDKCNNQRFEKTLYPTMEPFLTGDRGWGLRILEDIKEGSFVIEYVGEVIDEEEFKNRCLEMQNQNEHNYYFLTIDNHRMIDAGPKGNLSRFMNHSCEPNCVAQKWTVNGDTRIGLFALQDISAGTELVFDYRLQSCSGVEKKPCQCGATRCSKFIGVKVDKDEEKKKLIASDEDKAKNYSKNNKRKSSKHKADTSDIEKTDESKKSKIKPSTVGETSKSSKRNTSVVKGVTSSELKTCSKRTKRKLRNSLLAQCSSQTLKTKPDINQQNDDVAKTKKHVNPINCENSTQNSLVTNVLSIAVGINLEPRLSLKRLAKSRHSFLSKENYMKQQIDDTARTKTRKPKKPVNPINVEKNTQNHMVTKVVSEAVGTNLEPRQSLNRLAKSRHSFLSKNLSDDNNTKRKNITAMIIPKKEKKCEVNTVQNKKKHRGTLYQNKFVKFVYKNNCKDIIHKNKQEKILLKTKVTKKFKTNKHSLLTKDSNKNETCLVSGKRHAKLSCKNKKCPRVSHLCCKNKSKLGKSNFICPSQLCCICKKRKVVDKCKFCIKSFCINHVKGNTFKDPIDDGILCITHYSNNKLFSNKSYPAVVVPKAVRKLSNKTVKKVKPLVTASITPIHPTKSLTEVSIPLNDTAEDLSQPPPYTIEEKDYMLTQVIKDESDREFIHIGGFNVTTVSNLVVESKSNLFTSVNTDGDMLKPSSANVVIDIESASAFYQPIDSLNLLTFDCGNNASHDYVNVHFEPEIRTEWLADAEL
ncbi:histone-lysine N-methyltransferase NSD2-like isoform X2 [Adelges cooleyi]|uniref:histone-lysine N-methyltransferase NSD2-like isoform X2 n=1 Tax=Adelges cooleyi TaxID=133065 RepID=UPI00217F97E8|nr:histone-lysine N-methyltransferase NSD2-like isoform X2 [Adelges cooleyi]